VNNKEAGEISQEDIIVKLYKEVGTRDYSITIKVDGAL